MIEQLYQDFTTKLLPKIQEGLVITKEYFMDLFGRYVKFLLITVLFEVGVIILVMVLIIIILIKAYKKDKKDNWNNEGAGIIIVFTSFAVCILFIVLIGEIKDVIKDIYIPEIRIMEKLNIIKPNLQS